MVGIVDLDDFQPLSFSNLLFVFSISTSFSSRSYHLLLCVLDFIFHNVFLDRRWDLVDSRFPGLAAPSSGHPSSLSASSAATSSSFRTGVSSSSASIIEKLCGDYGGTAIEAKGVKVSSCSIDSYGRTVLKLKVKGTRGNAK